jgi:hypothetical protein
MRVVPICLLVACAAEPLVEVDTQRPPPTSELALSVSAVRPGQPATWIVDGLQPGERVLIVRGADVGPGACPPAAAGLCLDVTGPPSVLVRGTADAAGTATITLAVPPTLPLGFDVAFQAVALAGGGRADAAKSNPVARTTRATAPSDLSAADLVITEVMADPAAVTDANGEWFELRNAGATTVDLSGLRVADAGGGFTVNRPVLIEPGAHVVLARVADPVVNGGLWPAFAWRTSFGLANGADSLRLEDGPRLIDGVAWTGSTPGASRAAAPGVSALDNDDVDAWCDGDAPYGAGDLGSPGADNGPCAVEVCGDGIVQAGEECDLGALNGTAGATCADDCTDAALVFTPLPAESVPTLSPSSSAPNAKLSVGVHNNDGDVDVWLAWRQEVIAVEGRGDGGFYAPPMMDCGRNTAAVDLDEDGRTDLVGQDEPTGRMVVCWNNGGTWTRSLRTTLISSVPVAADLDADGNVDLAWSDAVAGGVQVMFGLGTRTLAAPTLLSTAGGHGPAAPIELHVADIDGDGRLDLVTPSAALVVVQLGLGARSFAPPDAVTVAVPGATGPSNIGLIDVDADGDLDVVATLSNTLAWVPNTPGGFGATAPIVAMGSAGWLAVGDVTGDGVLDLVTDETGTLKLYRGLAGAGTYTSGVVIPDPALGGFTGYGLALHDLDGDADLDLIASGRPAPGGCCGDFVVSHLMNDGSGAFTAVGTAGAGEASPTVIDVDVDGQPDVYTNQPYLVDPLGELRPAPRLRLDAAHLTTLLDANADGLPDAGSDYTTTWYLTGADRTYHPTGFFAATAELPHMAMADLTGDGNPEYIAVTDFTGATRIRVGVSSGGGFSYPDPAEVGPTPFSGLGHIAVADVSDDGQPDLVVTDTINGDLIVRLGDAARRFPTTLTFPLGAVCDQLLLADVTGDGRLDAVTVCQADDALRVLPGLGGGLFGAAIEVSPLLAPVDLYEDTRLTAADLDGDGLTDLAVVIPRADAVVVLRSFGGGLFGAGAAITPASRPFAAEAADFDGDGVQDLVLALDGPQLQTWRGVP